MLWFQFRKLNFIEMYFVYIILIIDFVFTHVIMWLKIACFNRNYFAHIFIYSSYFYILALFLNSKEITAHLSQQESEEMISSLTVNTTITTSLNDWPASSTFRGSQNPNTCSTTDHTSSSLWSVRPHVLPSRR